MIPLSAPASMASRRNASLRRRLPGIPNETLLMPPVTWISDPNRARIARIAASAWLPNSPSTDTGKISGST